MKRLLLCISLLTTFHVLWAQQEQKEEESIFKEASVIAPSPEATAMNQFIDLPVGHYTGIPNISVPIHTLKLPQMSLPISLNYHAGGLKVGEHSSWVGAGWSLSAGGGINRTVRGLPDEFTGNVPRDAGIENCDAIGYGYQRLDTAYFESDLSGISQLRLRNLTYTTGYTRSYTLTYNISESRFDTTWTITNIPKIPCPVDTIDFFDEGIYDSEPDLYHFSFPGGSGKFSYNRARQLVKISADDVDFDLSPISSIPNNNYQVVDFGTSSFRLIDAAGIQYTFSATEKTNTFSICVGSEITANRNGIDPNMAHISNWKLTRMSLMDNWINFEYEGDSITYEDHYNSGSYVVSGTGGADNALSFCNSERRVDTKRLTRIHTSNGYEVLFDKGGARLDLSGDERLSNIRIKKNGVLIKHYELDNDQYFGFNDKLKLNSVKQLSTTDASQSLPGYSFTYHNGAGDFPYIGSYSQDYWGYFNGADNGDTITGSMIPYTHIGNMVHANRNTHVNREPSLAHTLNGTLSKITYPTGGHTEFTYELNRFYHPVYQKIYTVHMDTVPDYNSTKLSDVFEVSAEGDVEILSHGTSVDIHTWKLEKWSGTSWVEERNFAQTGDFLLEPGLYQFSVTNYTSEPGEDNGGDPGFEGGDTGSGGTGNTSHGIADRITFRIVSKFTQEVTNEVSGGLRIQKMKFFDPLDSATLDKYFLYEEENGHSSGRQFTKAWVSGVRMSYMPGTQLNLVTCVDQPTQYRETISLSHSSTAPVATYQGSHVGYGSVYELSYTEDCTSTTLTPSGQFDPSCGLSGATLYKFHNFWTEQASALVPATDHSYKNGVKELDVHYKYSGSSANWKDNLVKLAETTYDYEEVDEGYLAKGVLIKETANSYCYQWEEGSKLQMGDVLMINYNLSTKWYRSTGQTTVQYDEDGENPTTTVSNVYYDSTVTHHFPTSSEVTESTGATLTTEQTRDATNPALMIKQEVFRQESVSSPVKQISGEQVTYHGVLPLSYSVWNRRHTSQEPINTNGYESAKIYTYGGGSLLKSSEDRPGTPSGARVAYLWSYDSSYVVAQITNITDQALEDLLPSTYSSFEDFAGETNHVDISSALQTIRANLTNINQMMTTYLFESPFGISKVIDPNGRESNYVYDDFGRLIRVKDHDGNVLSETEYNYSNE